MELSRRDPNAAHGIAKNDGSIATNDNQVLVPELTAARAAIT